MISEGDVVDEGVEAVRSELRQGVRQFLRDTAGRAQRRAAMAQPEGFDRALFERSARELGLGGVAVPEELGGLGLGFGEAAIVIEELGRRLVASPWGDTLVGRVVLAGNRGPVADETLSRMAANAFSVAAVGLSHSDPAAHLRARRSGDRDLWHIDGHSDGVVHGASVDQFLVVARDDDRADVGWRSAVAPSDGEPGRLLFVVDPGDPGVTVTPQPGLDHTRPLARVHFSAASGRLVNSRTGVNDEPAAALRRLAMVAAATESVAAAEQCLEETVAYLTVRRQFGRPIGSFQAIQHRCADLAVAVHGARATADQAVRVATTGMGQQTGSRPGDDLAVLAPLAKVVCTDVLMQVAAESLQFHGGIGFTFEHDTHLYLKRGKAGQMLLGSNSSLRHSLADAIMRRSSPD